jgi:hypothetical protein
MINKVKELYNNKISKNGYTPYYNHIPNLFWEIIKNDNTSDVFSEKLISCKELRKLWEIIYEENNENFYDLLTEEVQYLYFKELIEADVQWFNDKTQDLNVFFDYYIQREKSMMLLDNEEDFLKTGK